MPSGAIWVPSGCHLGAIWRHLVPSGAIWVPSGAIWVLLEALRERPGSVRERLGSVNMSLLAIDNWTHTNNHQKIQKHESVFAT